jgi:DNA-binding transcriptional ArsR family regulator
MNARRDVFQAIADPTRREIIGLIAQEPMNLNAISEKFDVSRQAVSLHIKILSECGLIVIKREGRERICKPRLGALAEVSEWVEQYRQLWEGRLDKLGSLLGELQAEKPKRKAAVKKRRKS